MKPPLPSPADEARRRLDAAAEVLGRLSNELGLATPDLSAPALTRPAESARLESERRRADEAFLRIRALNEQLSAEKMRANELARTAAIEAHAREQTAEQSRMLTAALEESGKRERQARLELAAERAEPRARPGEEQKLAPDERIAQLQARLAAMDGRMALLRAEVVRLETLRAKADDAVAASESSKRALESALRQDLRNANAALDRAAADAGAFEGRARVEFNALKDQVSQVERRSELRERMYRSQIAELETQLAAAQQAGGEQPSALDLPPAEAESAAPLAKELPAVDAVLDPGWSRLLRTARPPVENAYAHLRRLSAGPLSGGQRALLRLTAANLSSAVEALSTAELVLSDAPAPAAAPTGALLDGLLTTWEAAFRSKGLTLKREFSRDLPAAPHDSDALRLVLHHILRNTLEALSKDGTLVIKAHPTPEGALSLEFVDDGPGFPPAWLARRFEPFVSPRRGHAGLGLCAVRRTLRRWAGEATAANGAAGRGAHLLLQFAAPGASAPELKIL